MASAVVYGIAQEILKNLGSSVIQEIASAWGFRSALEKLKRNVSTIKDYLVDAEERQSHDQAVRGWLLRLAEVVYDADDLLDEFATVATRKQLSGGNQFTKGVSMFFSRYNQIAYPPTISRKIKAIREKLDAIVRVGNGFGLVSQSYQQGRVVRRRDESYSFVEDDHVIGRDADKNAILSSLLAFPSSNEEHDVICIVGMGGMGKTALAQLIYNDPKVEKNFGLKLWVCVSDVFDIKEITEKILKSATNSKTPMDQLQSKLRAEIGDKKYLLVLDDVWNEDREEWLKMRALLKSGRSGSKILITTRSSKTAKIMCTVSPHDLRGISKEKSWELFEKVAFAPGQKPPNLVDIGKDIVEKCANVPLAIRVLGSTLYGEDESKWRSLKNKSLAKISEKGGITSILKLSYDHLNSPLKNCFAYCALFPKDYNFKKDMLIELWMAEGFIAEADDESQSLEEVGEECFLTLLRRGFFQDAKMDEWGLCIESCKMHDLMHDLAQEVAGAKCKVLKVGESWRCQEKIYHLSFADRLNYQRNIPTEVLNLEHLRALLLPQQLSDGSMTLRKSMLKEITSSLTKLRVLDLHGLGLIDLPTSIGELIHLRYLDLSFNPIRVLPDSITELHNLQTLNLNRCEKLLALPTKIKRLVNLRSLDIGGCILLCHMPLGIGELTALCKLPLFTVLNDVGSAGLSDLKKLNNLRGKLHISFIEDLETGMLEAREGDLTCILGVNELEISFTSSPKEGVKELEKQVECDEVVLEGLKPHSNLRKLNISHYKGKNLPNWAMKESLLLTLSKLVEIELDVWDQYHCQPPAFSQLPLLKRLSLTDLPCVEYMEEMVEDGDHSSTSTTVFFPSLETLKLYWMYSLKGWWKGVGGAPTLSFPKLSKLDIHWCGNLTSLPSCPNVKEVHVEVTQESFSMMNIVTALSRLTSMKIDKAEDLLRIPIQCLLHLSELCIDFESSLVSTDKLGDLFATTLSSSLQSLSFHFCHKLRSIAKGLEHLTALERFEIRNCPQLDLECEEDKDEDRTSCCNDMMMPWMAFKTSLRSLQLWGLPQLVSLPRALRHLTNLRSLEIGYTGGLRELPEWISCFSSLQTLRLAHCEDLRCLPESILDLAALQELRILACPELMERCRRPNGSDCPKIPHIPLVIYSSVGEKYTFA